MSFVCMDCYEVYHCPFDWCPKASCDGQMVVEIDDLMIPIIIMLNQKGYITQFCCSGHMYDSSMGGYILFDDFMEDILEWEEVKEAFKNLPNTWHVYDNTDKRCLRYSNDSDNVIEKYEAIIRANLDMLKFVNDLPMLEY